ncbi:hypothetical protein [Allorhodopirellula solitaria]|uniref:Uncharacterized protein n=1 Tax=Allorhodopirellula solitaria TaxID=2527987 RepID=A0A5C5YDR5_9BACT|nr:hypothetical protein [Allorhodopirellula solitaria]TWT73887.1 hypothetical protein CA85_07690 [Allorhodopirellula solitaria]
MRDTYRSVGAIVGLALGLALMWLLGLGGMVPAAIFGAGGAVIGGMSGERLADRGGRLK